MPKSVSFSVNFFETKHTLEQASVELGSRRQKFSVAKLVNKKMTLMTLQYFLCR
jgi:hypothetical protein